MIPRLSIPSVFPLVYSLSYDRKMEWTDRFRMWIADKNISQAQAGERMGLTQGAISHWLTNRNPILLRDFFALCKAVDADPQMILFGATQQMKAIDEIRKIIDSKPEQHAHHAPLMAKLEAIPLPPKRRKKHP